MPFSRRESIVDDKKNMIYPVIYLNMPTTIRSFVRKSGDEYTIVINPRLSVEDQKRAYFHEARHIACGDLENDEPADFIEARRHKE